MPRPTFTVLLVATALSTVLAGCGGGPQWIVHSQATPDPFLNQKSFAVLPIDYTGYMVGGKTEADYLSEKKPDQQDSYQADKAAINDVFTGVLQAKSSAAGIQIVPGTGPQSAPFQIRPTITWLEPGYYAGVSAAPAELKMVLRVTSPDGKVLDEVELDQKGKGLATGLRLRTAAQKLGEAAGAYITSRAVPGPPG
jgi:hypothetical protein